MKNLNKEEEEEKLQHFIFSIDDRMENFVDKLSKEGYELDYSLSSLDELERYMIKEQIDNSDENLEIRTDCWIYLGEVFRIQSKKAIWEVSLNKENTANHGLYVLKGHSDKGLEFVPIRYIKAFILKKKIGLLKSVFTNHLSPLELNLDEFPTEEEPKENKN